MRIGIERLVGGETSVFSGVAEDGGGEGLWLSGGFSSSGFDSDMLSCD